MKKFTKNLYFNNITNKTFQKIKHKIRKQIFTIFIIASDKAFIKTFLQHF